MPSLAVKCKYTPLKECCTCLSEGTHSTRSVAHAYQISHTPQEMLLMHIRYHTTYKKCCSCLWESTHTTRNVVHAFQMHQPARIRIPCKHKQARTHARRTKCKSKHTYQIPLLQRDCQGHQPPSTMRPDLTIFLSGIFAHDFINQSLSTSEMYIHV